MRRKKRPRPASGSETKTIREAQSPVLEDRGTPFARRTAAPAVRQAAQETICRTVRVWVAELIAAEFSTEEVRVQLRPLLAALVCKELTAALALKRTGPTNAKTTCRTRRTPPPRKQRPR
jgi:hypothetical protein